MKKKYAVVVDPFSTGRLYPAEFRKHGIECIAIISSPDIPKSITGGLVEKDYAEILHWSPEVIDDLKSKSIACVVPGCEIGVQLCDEIAETLGLQGNHTSSSEARRHKYHMQMALKQAGVRHITSQLLHSPQEIDGAVASLSDDADYVIKPANSSGADGVVFARGPVQVRSLLEQCKWGERNRLGEVNAGFLLQEFVQGPEYVVDMVAMDGCLSIASVCRYSKIARNGAQFVYQALDVLDPMDPELVPLVDYAREAAKALDIRVGAIHMELIWSPRGPIMVEAGARMHGGVAPELFNETCCPGLLELTVNAYLREDRYAGLSSCRLVKHGCIRFFCSSGEVFHRPPAESSARTVPGYLGHRYFVADRSAVPPTIDLASCPGLFWMAHSDMKKLQEGAAVVEDMLWPGPVRQIA